MVEVLKYIILGLVQGLTEVLPISSSAHLIIFSELLGLSDDNLMFEVFLHLASLIAILVYLWPKLIKLINGFCLYVFKKDKTKLIEFRYCLFIVVSTIPVVITSLVFQNLIDFASNTLWFIGCSLIVNGIMLFILSRINGTRKEDELNFVDALVIGSFQCIGIFPGISRSGSCLSGAFTRRITKETAADYAFILFIPAIVGAFVLQLIKLDTSAIESSKLTLYLISFVVSAVSTYFAFKILLKIIRKGKLSWFTYYCLAVGLFVILYDLFMKGN